MVAGGSSGGLRVRARVTGTGQSTSEESWRGGMGRAAGRTCPPQPAAQKNNSSIKSASYSLKGLSVSSRDVNFQTLKRLVIHATEKWKAPFQSGGI